MASDMFRKPMESQQPVVEHYRSVNRHDDLGLYADVGIRTGASTKTHNGHN
jgi:hypothetical protein